jgi:hypothetical protein
MEKGKSRFFRPLARYSVLLDWPPTDNPKEILERLREKQERKMGKGKKKARVGRAKVQRNPNQLTLSTQASDSFRTPS